MRLEPGALRLPSEPAGGAGLAGALLSAMQLAAFERTPDGQFQPVTEYPEWFLRLAPLESGECTASALLDHLPALESFLPIALQFWATGSRERLQSDFWTETDSEGNDYHLLAAALTAEGLQLLTIERADAMYVERQQLQLYAHELAVQNETINRLNREVERATQAKSDFLATMSHEIRTPLNAILGMADLLAESDLDARQKRYVEVFQRAGSTLLALINDILDLSKVESGHLELESTDFDLTEVIGRALDLTRVKAESKGLVTGAVIAESVPRFLMGDPLRLRQVLLNLMGNAMKFTEAGQVEIVVDNDPGSSETGALLFCVRDTGIGIPGEKLGSIFENFAQADASTTRKYGGTGLGLAIAQRLIGLMGGRIWVESTLGSGSRFFFTASFPVSKSTSTLTGKAPALALEGNRIGAVHILLADDSEDNRFLIAEYLRSTGSTLDMAEDGEAALRKMMANEYDLVLMDANMPVMDGYEATGRMRAWERGRDAPPLPILALTADAFKESALRSAKAGFTAHLTKPIAKATLLEAIRRHARPREAAECAPSVAVKHEQPEEIEPAIARLAPRFLKNVESDLQALRAAEAGEDYATIQRIGHNLNGTGGSFGFPRITELGAALERAAKERAILLIRDLLGVFQRYLEEIQDSRRIETQAAQS